MSVERFQPRRGAHGRVDAKIRLERGLSGRLVLVDANGRRYPDIEPVRAFPFSDPSHWVSLRDSDARELLCIEDVALLESQSQAVLEAALARREFVPIIERVEHIGASAEPCEWEVITDRGPTRFTLNSEDDVRLFNDGRVLITDAHGTRYFIPDTQALDGASRRTLARYI